MTTLTTDRLGEAWLQSENVVDSLREALSAASNVESIIILQLIERVAILMRDINQLREFSLADAK